MIKKHDPAVFEVSLKVLLTNDHGEQLILLARSDNKNWSNKYDLPGGRINNDEIKTDFLTLVAREVTEEVGQVNYRLRPDPVAMSMWQYRGECKKMFILFEASYISGKIKLSEEHNHFTWQSVRDPKVRNRFPSVLKKLLNNYITWNK